MLLLCINFAVSLCWGTDSCGRLESGWAGGLWLVGFQNCVEDLVGEDG